MKTWRLRLRQLYLICSDLFCHILVYCAGLAVDAADSRPSLAFTSCIDGGTEAGDGSRRGGPDLKSLLCNEGSGQKWTEANEVFLGCCFDLSVLCLRVRFTSRC